MGLQLALLEPGHAGGGVHRGVGTIRFGKGTRQAVLELAPRRNLWRAAPRLPAALRAGHYLTRGLRYLLALRRAGISVTYGVSDLRAIGTDRRSRTTVRDR